MAIKESDIQLVGHGSSRPSLKKSMQTYCANRYKGTAYKKGVSQATWDGIPDWVKEALGMTYSGGKVTWHKGLICVLDPVGRTDENAKLSHDKYKTILGRNYYTNTSKRSCVYTPYTNGLYYSDCSSSVSKTHQLTINSKIGVLHTPGMMVSPYYKKVEGITVKNGHITSGIEKIRTSMALMFAGSDWGRLKYHIVGHVEMVYGKTDGTLLLDGSSATTIPASTPSQAADNSTNGGFDMANLKTLKKGDKGDTVKALQTLLIGYGYSCGNSGADGDFGKNTNNAVLAYQEANKLTKDGEVGPKTWSKLLGV